MVVSRVRRARGGDWFDMLNYDYAVHGPRCTRLRAGEEGAFEGGTCASQSRALILRRISIKPSTLHTTPRSRHYSIHPTHSPPPVCLAPSCY